MELQGNVTIAAPRERVWQALQDPEVLRACIPGCEEVRRVSPEELHARVMLKLGPVRAHFVGKVTMSDVRPGEGYRLSFEGSGGTAGFARGHSVVQLADVEGAAGGTRLDYTAEAAVAGKLGQVGGRLLNASARQLADLFFERLRDALGGGDAASATAHAPVAEAPAMAPALRASAPAAAPGVMRSAAGAAAPLGEATRLLWFAAGSAATALGVWLGAHLLR